MEKKEIKKISVPETNEAYNKIVYWFFSFPNQTIGLNDIAYKLKISKTTANRIITRLIKERFLKKETIGKTWRISCNSDHRYNKYKKIGYNLELINKSGILEIISKKFKNSQAIILFGSYRKGDDNEKSDIDIAVEVLGNENLKITNLMKFKEFGYRKNIEVNVHVFSRNKIDNNLFSNIANGIVLEGFLEVKNEKIS